MRYIINTFGSTIEAQKFLSGPENKIFKGWTCSSKRTDEDGERFTGTKSMEEADSLFLHGDRESLKRMNNTTAAAVARRSGLSSKSKPITDVRGTCVHVPNFLAGVPVCMIRREQVRVKNTKVLNFVYCVSASCNMDKEKIAEAGAQLLSYVRNIEAGGLRVNLYIMLASETKTEAAAMIIKVKDSGQYINPSKIAYQIINPSMLRRHFLRYIETADISDGHFKYGYGKAIDSECRLAEIFKQQDKIKADTFFTVAGMEEKMRLLLK